jgi:ArsR family transcriptional regulator
MSIYDFLMSSRTDTSATATAEQLALQLKALGDVTRLDLMLTILTSEHEDGACICDLTPRTKLGQSTVSHHMKLLVEAGLLSRTQKGKWAYFAPTTQARELMSALNLK